MINVVVGDITTMEVDVIVNAANPALYPGGGVCGAIHAAAGRQLEWECLDRFPMGCHTGSAVLTKGYDLPAKWVAHAVGPDMRNRIPLSVASEMLGLAYKSCLDLALNVGAKSIAFPAISTGIYGYPLQQAAMTAAIAIDDWFICQPANTEMDVTLVAFDEATAEVLRATVEFVVDN